MKPTILFLCLLFLCGCGCQTERGFPPNRQIANLDWVDDTVIRGAQPTRSALAELANHGYRTVINLLPASEALPHERETVEGLGMRYVNCPLSGTHAPTSEQMSNVLFNIEAAPKPLVVHCRFGCDRTGTVIACWRIKHGWSNADALREAEVYGLSRWEFGMSRFIKEFKP